ncbi:MAG: hypothetical protein WBA76_00015, partial [Phormidesmis sp.]
LSLALGIVVRLVQYLSNRSLWFDEVALVLNLQERSYPQLLGALSYDQAAPPLFLWVEKFALDTLGNHEYALRLYPLLGGLLSLGIFYRLTRTFATGWARPIAIFLFAVQSYIIYFAGEVKPYSWDVTLGLLLFMAIASLNTLRPSLKRVLGVGILGVVSIWLSFPSILVMAGVEATNVIRLKLWQASRSDWQAFLLRRLPLYAAWIISLGALYMGVVSQTLAETDLATSWADRYPEGWLDWLWLLDSFGSFFYRPLGFFSPADGLAIAAFLVGAIYLYRTQKWRLAYLLSPFAVTIVAAYLHKYPFKDRLILFLVPYALVILAEGMALLIRRWRKPRQALPKVLGAAGLALAISLLVLPLGKTLPLLVQPGKAHFDDVRPAIAYVHQHWQPGDKFYVFPWSQLQFQYYKTRFDLPPDDIVLSQMQEFGLSHLRDDDLQKLSQEINQLEAGPLRNKPRVWFLLSRKNADAEAAILERLDQLGAPVERTRYAGAVISLQNFSKPSP